MVKFSIAQYFVHIMVDESDAEVVHEFVAD